MRVLLPLPDRDFDVTKVAVPWSILRDAGHDVVFATERAGTVPAADPRLPSSVVIRPGSHGQRTATLQMTIGVSNAHES